MVPRATLAREATSRICTASYPPSLARAMAASMTRLRRAGWVLGRGDGSGDTVVEQVIVLRRHDRSHLGRRGPAAGRAGGSTGAAGASGRTGGVVRALGGAVAGGAGCRRGPLAGADPAGRRAAPGRWAHRPAGRPRRRG